MELESNSGLKKRSGGMVCIYKNCFNRQLNCGVEIKFFRVPKENLRCRRWLQACGREDLITADFSSTKANQKYRVCSIHFDPSKFNNPVERNRLLITAVPEDYQQINNDAFDMPGSSTSCAPDQSTKRYLETEDKKSSKKIKIHHELRIVPDLNVAVPPSPILSPVQTQTDKSLSSHSPRKGKLRQDLEKLLQENIQLKQELTSALEKLNNPREEQFKIQCDRFLTPSMSNFVKSQMELSKKSEHGRRYSNEFKQFSLSVYFSSPKCYRQLQNTFCLPSYRSLCRFIEHINFSAGINASLFQLLEIKVSKLQPLDKICILCLDEMSLKTNLFYNASTDSIIGLEDNGETGSNKPASSATVFMIRSIKSTWKQPVAYCLSSTAYNASDVKVMLENIIRWATKIGLDIICLVSDMGSNCIELSRFLGVTSENSKFYLGGKHLYYYFDPPHMLKAFRNNLLHYEFKWDDNTASWADIVTFYEKDKTFLNSFGTKLTKSHINPTNFERMRVKLAVQVVSNTVSAALETYVHLGTLPSQALGTSNLLGMFDKLFDLFNSSNMNSTKPFNKPFRAETYQIKFLQDMLKILDKLKVYDKSKNRNVTVKFISCWKISINSLLQLWTDMQSKGFQFILTRRLNQDCLENYFGTIRQHGNCVNPTPIQFVRVFKKTFVTSFVHTDDMNCLEDFDAVITKLADFSTTNFIPQITENPEKNNFQLESCDYYDLSLPEQNAFKYVCGYLIKKCLKIHSCPICEKFATDDNKLDNTNMFAHFKAYKTEKSPFGSLKTPHLSFYSFIYELEELFIENVDVVLSKYPGNSLFAIFKDVNFSHPCQEFPLIYLLKLYTRLRIYYLLKNSNEDFKTTPKKNRKVSILMNL